MKLLGDIYTCIEKHFSKRFQSSILPVYFSLSYITMLHDFLPNKIWDSFLKTGIHSPKYGIRLN